MRDPSLWWAPGYGQFLTFGLTTWQGLLTPFSGSKGVLCVMQTANVPRSILKWLRVMVPWNSDTGCPHFLNTHVLQTLPSQRDLTSIPDAEVRPRSRAAEGEQPGQI